MQHPLKNHPVTPLADTGYIRIMPLSHYLGVSHKTLRKWIVDGKIPAPKVINGIQLFDNAEVQHWLSQTADSSNQSTKEGL